MPDSVVEKEEGPQWKSLFDGETLGSWAVTNFTATGGATVKDGVIELLPGEPLGGTRWVGVTLLTADYEIFLEARWVEGDDFF